ncbi:MAG: hypothetical protein QM679_05880 [Patulibacter sp.]
MHPRRLLPLLAVCAAAIAPTSALADQCVEADSSQAFASVDGDTAYYTPAPGGGFEANGKAWTLTGAAATVAGNETLGIKSGSRALRLPLGSTATSPEFCVDETKPHFRFAYKVDNAYFSGFLALVIYRDTDGEITNVELTSSKRVTALPTRWQASEASPLATLLPLTGNGGETATVQIKFISLIPADVIDDLLTAIKGSNPLRDAIARAQSIYQSTLAAWWSPYFNIGVTIDSVMVDPYRRG